MSGRGPSLNRFVVSAVAWAGSTLLGVLLGFVVTIGVAGDPRRGVASPVPQDVSSPPPLEAMPSRPSPDPADGNKRTHPDD